MRRIVVAEAPFGGTFWSGAGPVGLIRFREADVWKVAVAIRVRSTLAIDGGDMLPGSPLDPIGARGHRVVRQEPLGPHELVPGKRACDVSLTGHVVRGEPRATERGLLRVGLGEDQRTLGLWDEAPRLDAATARVVAPDGAEAWLGVKCRRTPVDERRIVFHEELDDHQHAPPSLRFDRPKPGTAIVVRTDRVLAHGRLGFGVQMRVDFDDDTVASPDVRCDGIVVHLEQGLVDWLFRAVVQDPSRGGEIERVAFAITPDDRRAVDLDPWLAHARFGHVAEAREVVSAVHTRRMEEEELLIARYSTWDLGPSVALLPVEEVAEIQVELERHPERSGAVLREHELDDYEWSLEQRALAEAMAESAVESAWSGQDGEDGEGALPEPSTVALRYGDALHAARSRSPVAVPDLASWARLRAALESSDAARAVASSGMSIGAIIATDAVLETALETDDAMRARFETLVEGARVERRGAAARDRDETDEESAV